MNKPSKIFRPCDSCVHEKNCPYDRGCYQWRVWFRAYWNRLKQRFLTEG